LYLLRCVRIGLHLSDLDLLEFGEVMGILIEAGNDNYKYRQVATQADFDKF
jgi:hypothetical protein